MPAGRRLRGCRRQSSASAGQRGDCAGALVGDVDIRVSGAGSRGQCREDANLAPVAQGLGRVLVVDDDEVIRQLIAVNLTLEGFDVATAVDGQDCLDQVTAIDPDVITLDIMMPRLDGWMTASLLRRNPETSTIKVVLITARAQEVDKSRGRQRGVAASLT